MHTQTRSLALAGILSALAVTLLCLGSLIPFATYACQVLASLAVGAAGEECTPRCAWSCWAAAAALGLMLAPDKEVAMLFVFLGWYPLAKPRLDRLRPAAARAAAKLLLGGAAIFAMYALLIRVLRMEELVREYAETSAALLAATLVLGAVTFLIYDLWLTRLTQFYRRRKQKRRPLER